MRETLFWTAIIVGIALSIYAGGWLLFIKPVIAVCAAYDAIGNMAIAFVGTSGVQMGWLASQADMLAEDWMFAE